jgi:hypothetical protein
MLLEQELVRMERSPINPKQPEAMIERRNKAGDRAWVFQPKEAREKSCAAIQEQIWRLRDGIVPVMAGDLVWWEGLIDRRLAIGAVGMVERAELRQVIDESTMLIILPGGGREVLVEGFATAGHADQDGVWLKGPVVVSETHKRAWNTHYVLRPFDADAWIEPAPAVAE